MIHLSSDDKQAKGWLFGPWNSGVPVSVGYANEGVEEKHYHRQVYEIYLIAQGHSTMLVDGVEVHLKQGDAIALEPNEVHTFLASSENYLHFVIHTPFVQGDKVVLGPRDAKG